MIRREELKSETYLTLRYVFKQNANVHSYVATQL